MGFEYEVDDLRLLSTTFQSDRRDPYGVEAFAYYGSFGLIDPKAPFVDAPATASALGVGYFAGLMVAVATGFVVAGTIGWLLDPHHKHARGMDEWYVDEEGDYLENPLFPSFGGGGYDDQPSDMAW